MRAPEKIEHVAIGPRADEKTRQDCKKEERYQGENRKMTMNKKGMEGVILGNRNVAYHEGCEVHRNGGCDAYPSFLQPDLWFEIFRCCWPSREIKPCREPAHDRRRELQQWPGHDYSALRLSSTTTKDAPLLSALDRPRQQARPVPSPCAGAVWAKCYEWRQETVLVSTHMSAISSSRESMGEGGSQLMR